MPAQFNVAGLLKDSIGSLREHDVDLEVAAGGDGEASERVSGRARLLRTADGILATATLSGAHHERCSRCLRDLDLPLEIEVEEEFYPTVDVETGARLRDPEEGEHFHIDERHDLDLAEAVRQYWQAARPMQPLCRAGCRGLCPRCGKDLNEGDCACQPEADERWSALRNLVAKGEGS